jgi:hypothetical protein
LNQGSEESKKSQGGYTLKYALVLGMCVMFRLVPRPPNVEPIMTGMVPFGRKLGALAAGVFAILAVVVYDAAANQIGPWTLATAVCYGIVGAAGGWWLSGRKNPSMLDYGAFAVIATLFYDAVTALAFGYYFGYPLSVTIAGQVPFTLLHLASNVFGVLLISPLIMKYVVDNPQLTFSQFTQWVPEMRV